MIFKFKHKNIPLSNLDLVNLFYKVILEREPDQAGLYHHIKKLDQNNNLESITHVFKDFLNSEEYKNNEQYKALGSNYKTHFDQLYANNKKELISSKPINHIISLGDHCFTSYLLKNYQLKRYSLPFDWIFSSPEMIIHCIENNFSFFLDQSKIQSTINSSNEPSSNHSFYEKHFNIKNMFNHSDLTIDTNYQYIKRSVERFGRLLESNDNKLFILIGRVGSNLASSFNELIHTLDKNTNNFALLAIELQTPPIDRVSSKLEMQITSGNHKLFKYYPTSSEDGLLFENRVDEIQIINLILCYELDLLSSI